MLQQIIVGLLMVARQDYTRVSKIWPSEPILGWVP